MDGKHARRTGNSSPLGLLFDHGCDAVTTFLFACGLGTVIGLGKPSHIILRFCTVVWNHLAHDLCPILSQYFRRILYRGT